MRATLKVSSPSGLSVDASGQYVVIASKSSLPVFQLSNPWAGPLKTLHQESRWEVGRVGAHPLAASGQLVAAVVHDSLLVWDVSCESRTPLESSLLKAHSRALTDFDWAPDARYVVATGSRDRSVSRWDIRQPRRATSSVGVGAAVTSVRYSRRGGLLAVAADEQIMVFDERQPGRALETMAAHVRGGIRLDWAYDRELALASLGSDQVLRWWDLRHGTAAVAAVSVPVMGSGKLPSLGCTPFGAGVLVSCGLAGFSLFKAPPVNRRSGELELATSGVAAGQQIAAWDWRGTERVWETQWQVVAVSARCELLVVDMSSAGLETPPARQMAVSRDRMREDDYLSFSFEQEMAWLATLDMPGVEVRRRDAADRAASFRVVCPPRELALRITFPSLYPRMAPPSFEISAAVELTPDALVALKLDLSELADRHVSRSQPCVRACLNLLVNALSDTTKDSLDGDIDIPLPSDPDALDSDVDGGFLFMDDSDLPDSPRQPRELLKTSLSVPIPEPEIEEVVSHAPAAPPAPGSSSSTLDESHVEMVGALCGAAFSPSGLLVRFGAAEVPSFAAQLGGGLELITSLYDENRRSDLLNDVRERLVRIVRPRGMLRVDLLARVLVLEGRSPREVCEMNAWVAQSFGRRAALQAFLLLAQSCAASEQDRASDPRPWAQRPLGRLLVREYLRSKRTGILAFMEGEGDGAQGSLSKPTASATEDAVGGRGWTERLRDTLKGGARVDGQFHGRELIDWVRVALGLSEAEAPQLGQRLLDGGAVFAHAGDADVLDRGHRARYGLTPLPSVEVNSALDQVDHELAGMARQLAESAAGSDLTPGGSTAARQRGCVVAADVTEWLVRRYRLRSRPEGVLLGQALVNAGVLAHSTSSRHPFRDGQNFFQLRSQPAHFGYLAILEAPTGTAAVVAGDQGARRLRWFCLRSGRLVWYRHAFATQPLGQQDVGDCQLSVWPASRKHPLVFEVRAADGRRLELSAPGTAQLKGWISTLYSISCHADNDRIVQSEMHLASLVLGNLAESDGHALERQRRQREGVELRLRRVYFDAGASATGPNGALVKDTYVQVDFSAEYQLALARELDAAHQLDLLSQGLLDQQRLQRHMENEYFDEVVALMGRLRERGVRLPWEIDRAEVAARVDDLRACLNPPPQLALYGVCSTGHKRLLQDLWAALSDSETRVFDAVERARRASKDDSASPDPHDEVGAVVEAIVARALARSRWFPCSVVIVVLVGRRMWLFSHGGAHAVFGIDFWRVADQLESPAFLRSLDDTAAYRYAGGFAKPPANAVARTMDDIPVRHNSRTSSSRSLAEVEPDVVAHSMPATSHMLHASSSTPQLPRPLHHAASTANIQLLAAATALDDSSTSLVQQHEGMPRHDVPMADGLVLLETDLDRLTRVGTGGRRTVPRSRRTPEAAEMAEMQRARLIERLPSSNRHYFLEEVPLSPRPCYDFVVLGNDIFWRVMQPKDVSDYVSQLRSARRPACEIADLLIIAAKKRSREACTAMVMFWHFA